MKPGVFLKSTALLDGTIFEDTIVYIAEYNDDGALGFIINKKFQRALNELEEFRHNRSFPIYVGGPVDQEHLYFVHQRPELIGGGAPIADSVWLGGDFASAVKNIDGRLLTGHDVKIFLGYCGWNKGELEAEIAEGSWEPGEEGPLFSEG